MKKTIRIPRKQKKVLKLRLEAYFGNYPKRITIGEQLIFWNNLFKY